MRSVLCYGDSNTHGQVPGGTPLDRYGPAERWPGVMAKELGVGWHVIEEGLSGRTTVRDDPIEGAHKNGRTYLRPCLQSHAVLDLVIIMLGTNDLKARFNQPASEVAMAMGCLVYDIKELKPGPGGSVPEIMIVSPPPMLDDIKDWPAFNKVYVTYFPDGKYPARSAFGADGLALGALLEVECLAYAPAARG